MVDTDSRSDVDASSRLALSAAPILQLAMGFMASKHLFTANAIGLFEHLADGPITLDTLAARAGVPARTVRMIADAMVALGLVDRMDEVYTNGPLAAAFLSGRASTDLRP